MADGLPFHLELNSGRGLLDARALWAAVVGPQRLAMGSFSSVVLQTQQPKLLAKNIGAAEAYVFVGVSLPADAPVASLRVLMRQDESLGNNSSAPFLITPVMTQGQTAGFVQLLQPGEQLFGQISDPTFAGTEQRVVVSTVTF